METKKKKFLIKNCNVVLENGILNNGCILVSDGIIENFGVESEIKTPLNYDIIDAKGDFVGPGFVDIHVHMGNGYSTYNNVEKASEYFLKHGTTTMLSTPEYALTFESMINAIKNVKNGIKNTKNVKGLYMEGPYINPKYGAGAQDNPWKNGIVENEYKALVDECGELVKVWTIAPELENIVEFIKYARKVNPNVKFAIGHSEASYSDMVVVEEYVSIQTHAFNATGKKPEEKGVVGYGPDEYCMQNDKIACEIISDCEGAHLKSEIQKYVVKMKGVENLILITDCFDYADTDGNSDVNRNKYGELCGSLLTMEKTCRNIIYHAGVSMVDAFNMASRNPAKAIGLIDKIGSIAKGKVADLVIVDNDFNVKKVISNGEIIGE